MCVRCVVRFFGRLHRNSAGRLYVWQGISGQYDGKSASRLRTKPQAGFIQCFLKAIPHKDCAGLPKKAVPFRVRLLLLWNEGCGGGILWNLLLLFQVSQKKSLRLPFGCLFKGGYCVETPPPPNGGSPRTERSPLPCGHLPTPWGVTPFRGGFFSSTKLPRRGEQAAAAAVTLPFSLLRLGRRVSGDPPRA